jgi:hypothetical protein
MPLLFRLRKWKSSPYPHCGGDLRRAAGPARVEGPRRTSEPTHARSAALVRLPRVIKKRP